MTKEPRDYVEDILKAIDLGTRRYRKNDDPDRDEPEVEFHRKALLPIVRHMLEDAREETRRTLESQGLVPVAEVQRRIAEAATVGRSDPTYPLL
jgi:hypothetical protein